MFLIYAFIHAKIYAIFMLYLCLLLRRFYLSVTARLLHARACASLSGLGAVFTILSHALPCLSLKLTPGQPKKMI